MPAVFADVVAVGGKVECVFGQVIPPLNKMPALLPVSLKELLAIPLSNLKTIAKWLVISSILSRKR